MHEHALKELRILKKRLDPSAVGDISLPTKSASKQSDGPSTGFGELLDFRGNVSTASLSAVTAHQIQVLKLVAATKKPAHIVDVLPFLGIAHPTSPVNLLSRIAKENEKESAKAARQVASLSQILFSLAPSVSSKDDAIAAEPRLSPSPIASFEVQRMAFAAQLRWWKLAGHQGNVDEEVLAPFLRCVRALIRRENSDKEALYNKIATAFEEIMQLVRDQKHQPTLSSSSPSASLYQLLGSTAQEARRYDDAYRWFQVLRELLQPDQDPSIRIFSISARLLSVALKRSTQDSNVEKRVSEVVESLEGSLSGTITDLNELLESLSLARRSVVGMLMGSLNGSTETSKPDTLNNLLKTFVLRYPRFLRRWLGMPPAKDASTKQVLQFDQRRQLILQTLNQVLDATLMVIKCDIQRDTIEWQTMDEVIQDCFTLLSHVTDVAMPVSKLEQFGGYRVKMSSLCYGMFSQLRKIPDRPKTTTKHMLQALSRSIELVKDCSLSDKEKAQISTKLEVFADLCKSVGRGEEAVQTLRSICRTMAEEGALSNVASMLASKPPVQAWSLDPAAATLSRTLRSIAKLDKSWNDWTFFLPESERAAVLEHLMDINSAKTTQSEPNRLRDPCSTALLRIYTLERYPIRRLRVLLHLYSQNIGNGDELEEIISEVDDTLEQMKKRDKVEDAGLTRFLPHMMAYHSSLSALASADDTLAMSILKEAASAWKTMLEPVQTNDDIYSVIDNPDAFLDHLQSASLLADLRGENQLKVSLLDLSIAVTGAQGRSTSDGLVLNHCLLATTYTSIGLFPRALKTLMAANELISQCSGVSKGAMADYYLSQAEYYASIGHTVKA
jgi:separase